MPTCLILSKHLYLLFLLKNENMQLLTLIRHGQSTYNLENRFTGNIDAPLTSLGEEEAREAGKKIKNLLFNRAYTSEMVFFDC